MTRLISLIPMSALVLACGSDSDEVCDPIAQSGCEDGLVCEVIENEEEPACFAPVTVRGQVFDLEAAAAIEGARIVALDINGAPVSAVAISNASGEYALDIPSTRTADGTPIGVELTLRADAAGFQSFPGGIRQSLPIDTSTAVADGDGYLVESSLTDVGLLALPAGSGTGAISGTVEVPPDATGVLVVAEGPEARSTIADRSGEFVIFNLAAGDYEVAGYARGVNYQRATAAVAEGDTADAELLLDEAPTSTLSGMVEIVDATGDPATSVILVVASTFDETLVRGATPPGLRAPEPGIAPDVRGAFSIEGVPAGDYMILAAFENDTLVRDPDSCIAGTEIVSQSVGTGEEIDIATSFKVTEALDVINPGASGPEAIDGSPTLQWSADASADQYDITVVDGFGNIVWEHQITGTAPETQVSYAGPGLESGSYYQFRVLSSRANGPTDRCEISQTEDLEGVFFVP